MLNPKLLNPKCYLPAMGKLAKNLKILSFRRIKNSALVSTAIRQKVIKIDKGRIKSSKIFDFGASQFATRTRMRRRYSSAELLRCGVINLDKPRGPKCKHVLVKLRVALGAKKLGHAGTLDPNTTGVLPILVGKATKLSEILSTSDKIYRGKFKLHKKVSKKKLKQYMTKFEGIISQLPPKISAVKRVVREREVYWFKLLKFKNQIASFEMACQHGTYVRKVCHDLGESLGVGAHMFELERIQSGPFVLRKSVSFDKVCKLASKYRATGKGKYIRRFISPPEAAVKYVPKAWVDDRAIATVRKGTPVFVPGVLRVTNDFAPGKTVAVLGQDNKLKALGVAKLSIKQLKKQRRGVAVKTDLVLV